VSADTRALLTPERLPENNGWRVWARCTRCGIEVAFDSPDTIEAGDLYGLEAIETDPAMPDDEREIVTLDEPAGMALTLLEHTAVCDECRMKQDQAEAANRRHASFSDRLRRSELPGDLRGFQWIDADRSSSTQVGCVAAARAWTESAGGHLLIYGAAGRGKTWLAAAAVWNMLERRDVQWVSVPTLISWALAEDKSPERRAAMRAVGGDGALVLDDLGKEKPSEWARQLLFSAIDRRIQAGRPLLITSNYDPDELAARMGESIGSRLAAFVQVEMLGEDRRLFA
jgi:DNA replication protein DnaC